ncbi:DUF3581 domain-containing protein [Reinekea marina]|uniref:DUF3581 domain-containing protein n=1 Tax=Reinekea marina TaxID=1310421 RepID=A0ABV7WUA4_9GAMM|nr:DUF3581 domain-containing protein [Reinekea marina]MDN3648799.1 DUF3581 domain-containing protein [Reinekea marina]
MFLDEFHTAKGQKVIISAEQASRFAKEIAGDFNPIHDPDAKRFCVPGDLLFAISLSKYGLSQNMKVSFSGMVGRDLPIVFPNKAAGTIELKDENDKLYTTIEHSGAVTENEALISEFVRNYVEFSGQNFPYILVPLLDKHQVMFNPKRPLVIYESMSFNLDTLDIAQPSLELVDSTLEVNGKRGDVHFIFAIKDGDRIVGKGDKKLIVSGIQPFDKALMDEVVANFNQLKADYRSA